MGRAPRLVCLVAAALVLVTSCSGGSERSTGHETRPSSNDDAAASEFDAEWKPSDVYESLASKIVDGRMPTESALQMFALQYGPIPGVQVPEGKRGPAREGNLAIFSVFEAWPELTTEQKAAVRKALDLPEDFEPAAVGSDETTASEGNAPGDTDTGGSGGEADRPSMDDPSGVGAGGEHPSPGTSRAASTVAGVLRRMTDGPGAEQYRRSLDRIRPVIERHLGSLGVPVVIEVVTGTHTEDLADTIVLSRRGEGRTCRMRVFPERLPSPEAFPTSMAHELVHCYQQVWSPRYVPWMAEGGAHWAAMTALAENGDDADDSGLGGWFAEYNNTASRPLFNRSYDAVGWWAHLREQGGDVWGTMRAVITAGSSTAAYRVATAGAGEGLVAEWGTSQSAASQLGQRWFTEGPGVPEFTTTIDVTASLANGAHVTVASPAYATARSGRILDGDLLRVNTSGPAAGYLRIDDTDHPLAELTGTTWCTRRSGECVCPPHTRRAGERFTRLGSGTALVGLSAGTEAGAATFTAVSLEDECQQQPNCLIGTWTQDGPPVNDLFTTVSGGGGATVTFSAEGQVTFDYSTMQPWEASPRSDPAGVITARLDGTGHGTVEYPDPPSSTATVTVGDVDMSSVTGSATMKVNGVDVGSVGGDMVRQLWGAAEGSTWTVASCEGDTMTMQAGSAGVAYHRRA